MQSFQQDCVELAFQRFRRGEVGRRTLLAGLAALGAVPALSGEAAAQAQRQLVMVNWMGSSTAMARAALGSRSSRKQPSRVL